MSKREPIAILCPKNPEGGKLRRDMVKFGGVIDRVIRQAVHDRPTSDLMTEIYLAGLWHGAEMMRQNGGEMPKMEKRQVDRIDVMPQRRRGRPRKDGS